MYQVGIGYCIVNQARAKIIHHLAKDLEETPDTEATEDGNCEVVIQSADVSHLARRSNKAGPQAHDAQSKATRDRRLGRGQADRIGEEQGQAEGTSEHEELVAGHGTLGRHQPAPEEGRGAHADQECGQGPGKRLAGSNTGCVTAVQPSKGACRRVTPTEQQGAHDTDILGEEAQHDPGPEEVENDAIVARKLALAHQRPQYLDVEPVKGRVVVSEHVHRRDGY